MKITGTTRLETKKTIAELEKQYRKTKKAIWLDLAERLKKPSRKKISVNIWKIEKISGVLGEKALVVPGKVLGFGELSHKTTVIALEYSKEAKKKISEKGHALTFKEAIEKKIKPSEMAIVK